MLFTLLQTAHQTSAPIPVVVMQQPGGLSDTTKILLTVSVGTMLGIASNIAMEYVKPYIAARVLKRSVKRQIIAELMQNISVTDLINGVLSSHSEDDIAGRANAVKMAVKYMGSITNDRYMHYFEVAKPLVYELDEHLDIASFYRVIGRNFPATKGLDDYQYLDVLGSVFMADSFGKNFLSFHELKLVSRFDGITSFDVGSSTGEVDESGDAMK